VRAPIGPLTSGRNWGAGQGVAVENDKLQHRVTQLCVLPQLHTESDGDVDPEAGFQISTSLPC
jgi:hypothetical protein